MPKSAGLAPARVSAHLTKHGKQLVAKEMYRDGHISLVQPYSSAPTTAVPLLFFI